MTRREAAALLVAAALILAGRGLRHWLLVGPDGAWRDPEWLATALPPLESESPDPEPARAVLMGPLAVNTCPAESLVALPGVGPVLAGRIATAREQGVRFANLDDLQQIKGIGPRLAAKLAPWVVFGPFAATDTCRAQPAMPPPARVP